VELHELVRVGSEGPLPATIELADCSGSQVRLQVCEWLHVTPARHDVLARWGDRYVLARFLTGPDSGLSLEREKTGARQLAAQDLPRLVLLREGRTPELNAWLLYEAGDDAQSLDLVWRDLTSQPPLTDAQQALMGEALGALGSLHGKGLWPADPALRNFIRYQGQVHLLDAGTLCGETPGSPLARDKVLVNLGQFFAQFPARFEPWYEELLVFYLLANGEHALPLEALLKEVAKAREQGMRQQLAQLDRESPVCAVKRGAGMLRVVLRSEEARLRAIVADPEAAIRRGVPSEAGGDVLAVRLETSTGPVRLIRCPAPAGWRRLLASPAWRAWINGQRRYLLGETTRRPLAVLEQRRFGLRGASYLISEADTEDRG
jgi:hypothetical protein